MSTRARVCARTHTDIERTAATGHEQTGAGKTARLHKSVSFSGTLAQDMKDPQGAGPTWLKGGGRAGGGDEEGGGVKPAGCFACFGVASKRVRVAKAHCRQGDDWK